MVPVALANAPATSARYSRLISRRLRAAWRWSNRRHILPDDQEPRGVTVDPVHDAPSVLRSKLDDLGISGQKPICKGATRSPRPGMDDHAGRLVDDDHVFVLERDGKLNGLLGDHRRFLGDEIHPQDVSFCNL